MIMMYISFTNTIFAYKYTIGGSFLFQIKYFFKWRPKRVGRK